MITAELLNELVRIFQSLPGFIGIIEYGSGAKGTNHGRSDIDLVVVLEQPISVARFHSKKVDLNFLSFNELSGVLSRLEKNNQFPWDTMINNLNVVFDPQGELQPIVQQFRNAFAKGETFKYSEIEGLRFLATRLINDVEAYSHDDLMSSLFTYKVLTLVLMVNRYANSHWWLGIKEALSDLRINEPKLYNIAMLCIRESNIEQKLLLLRRLCTIVFAPWGGLWNEEPLILESDLHLYERASKSLQISPDLWQRILSCLEHAKM